MLQCELVRALDDIPQLDSAVTAGTCQDVVGIGMESDIADFPVKK